MDKESLKQYLSNKYQGSKSFLDNVIVPIFGEDNVENRYETDLLIAQPETRKLAEATGIHSVKQIGLINIGIEQLYIFDITVGNRIMMERNRVNIQRLIRSVMDSFSSAFMIFHYEGRKRWDWRFTYCHKGGTKQDASDSKRYTFLLGPGQSCRTAAENFFNLFDTFDKKGNIEISDIEKAFDVEALSNEFFDKYLGFYASFVKFITGKPTAKETGKNKITRKAFVETIKQMDTIGKSDKLNQFTNVFNNDEKAVNDYIKKLLGRITFMHFLQKKLWLCGDPNYMRNLFNECGKDRNDYLERILEPLFFGILNTGAYSDDKDKTTEVRKAYWKEHNSKAQTNHNLTEWDISLLDKWKDVPYLNGGLFEDDTLDRKRVRFPAEMFDALFEFFYQYNFTIDENDPNDAQVGVDPEMLGRIFENLLEDNKNKGAFYTPKEIVQYMCRQSLIAYLQTDITDEATKQAIADFVKTYDVTLLGGADTELARTTDQRLKDVKICDPAIGSGAFPMGLLKELFLCRGAIEKFNDAAEIKKHIIQNNIYGVDIERGAVDIARLRFWLALVVDETKPEPLPNLDFKIMQGNSLLESYEGIDLSKLNNINSDIIVVEPKRNLFGQIDEKQLSFTYSKTNSIKDIQKNINDYFSSNDHTKKQETKGKINNNVKTIISYNIELRVQQQERFREEANIRVRNLNSQIENIKKQFQDSSASKLIKELQTKICKEQTKINGYEATILKLNVVKDKMSLLDIAANEQFFLWHTWFSDVFSRPSKEGFDIVIGNPPYVEAKKLKYIASTLKRLFTIYSGTADLSIYFIEQGINLLKENGILSYITTNKFLNTGYGRPVRKLISEHHINQLINFEQVEVFEGILVSSVILNIQNHHKALDNKFVYEQFYKFKTKDFRREFIKRQQSFGSYSQDFLDENEWSFSATFELLIKSKIEKNATILKNIEGVSVYRGVTTGYNPAFIISNKKRDELIAEDIKNADVIKNMLQGRNIRKWYYNESNENLIFVPWHFPLKKTNINGASEHAEDELENNYPSLYRHLSLYKQELSSRNKEETGIRYEWYTLQRCAASYYPEFEKPEKIIWGLTADKWAFAYDSKQHYLPSNGYILTSQNIPIKYLLGLINSKLMHYYFNFIGVMTAGGAYTLKAATIESLPVIIAKNQSPIISLVEKILEIKGSNTQADTSDEEYKIDNFVYQLYDLTDDEIKIVEEKVK